MAAEVEIKDFTFTDAAPRFKVKDDVFVANPDIPLGIMQQLGRFSKMSETIQKEGMEPILEMFDELLDEQSAATFRTRVIEKKIGVKYCMAIIPWLIEQYGLRPTQPSSPSSDGSHDGETGTSSGDGS